MEINRRFTILTFPQFFDGAFLDLRVLFLPRNQNPLKPAIEADFVIPDAAPFADAELSFTANIISGLSSMPGPTPSVPPIALTTTMPGDARAIFEALATHFSITNLAAANTNASVNSFPERAPDPVKVERSVQKYLPVSYRQSFNFVAPRIPNAVVNDAYHCAVRDAAPTAFTPSPETVSWGQVFAHVMRQPLLAEAVGMVYQARLKIDAAHFPKGGWLFVDLADDSDYRAQQTLDAFFARRYAARIPPLTVGQPRQVFAAVQFPVLPSVPPGNFDEIFIETADYDDGFAKVVHAFQPVSDNLLAEESDGFHPTKDTGIRLGWDDEQILIWYVRQLAEDPKVGLNQRIDAPIGVSGYHIDVRQHHEPPLPWESLNLVRSRQTLTLNNRDTGDEIVLGDYTDRELPYQVYPARLDGDATKSFWLPMYFAAWGGGSVVLPDADAAAIYQHGDAKAIPTINVTAPPSGALARIYEAAPITTPLRYGTIYDFRVRLRDLSGGGPTPDSDPQHTSEPQVTTVHFVRHVAPNPVRLNDLPVNSDEQRFEGAALTIQRPLLGYPAVVFTGKYADPVTLLTAASVAETTKNKDQGAFGIADPDVERVEIVVEVQTLALDNLMSVSGRDSYIKFYTTTRRFPTASPVFDDTLTIPLEYRDCKILNFGDPANLGDLGMTEDDLDRMDELVLPTGRTIRLTIRGVCAEQAHYYALERDDHNFNTRYGRTIQCQVYSPSVDETGLFADTGPAETLRGIYLQPDPPFVYSGNPLALLLGTGIEKAPDSAERLAQQLDVDRHGLTLVGKRGQRVQFGCSHRIRHTLSPDNAAITFASQADLANHWLCAVTLEIERDWTWDALEARSIVVRRRKRFLEDNEATETEDEEIGDIEIKRTAPFTALDKPDRGRTLLVFIDAVEPKNERKQQAPHQSETRFPDLIDLEYILQPQFRPGHGAIHDDDVTLSLTLPIATAPAQVPKIVSAGLALSPYRRNKAYSATEPRRRYLWIEFEEPVLDSKDTYFARVLAYGPDQLISNNSPELLVAPEEPGLALPAEPIRIITFNQSHDAAGLDAMMPMEKAIDSDRIYLLPLPNGLHAESPEMFGFFTYELRLGHYRYTDATPHHAAGEDVWTLAHSRYGRPLRVTGLQHPAPTLTCTVNRDEEKLYVSAPYAVAVHNGRNVTADPPRTSLWCLLYAQVRQADNQDFLNILLDDRRLDPAVRVEHDKKIDWNVIYTDRERLTLKKAQFANFRDEVVYNEFRHVLKLADVAKVNKDATKYGTTIWSNVEVAQLLAQYGLPHDAPLSVVCVEMLPQITNWYEHVTTLHRADARAQARRTVGDNLPDDQAIDERLKSAQMAAASVDLNEDRPLTNQLGNYRILRTSPLTEVPYVCCTTC